MKRAAVVLSGVGLLAILCWAFPPFHVRSLKDVRAAQSNAQFNSTNFVEHFWKEKLLPAAENATAATRIVESITTDPQKAREEFGRSVGISSSYYFFLRGSGRVVSASDDSIGLSLRPEGDGVDILIPLGLVFGNAVRDGTGLLDSSHYPNAQEFNDIAAGLNQIVETQVLPELQRIATVGAMVHFAGCVEVADEDEDLKPLKLVPIVVKAE